MSIAWINSTAPLLAQAEKLKDMAAMYRSAAEGLDGAAQVLTEVSTQVAKRSAGKTVVKQALANAQEGKVAAKPPAKKAKARRTRRHGRYLPKLKGPLASALASLAKEGKQRFTSVELWDNMKTHQPYLRSFLRKGLSTLLVTEQKNGVLVKTKTGAGKYNPAEYLFKQEVTAVPA